MIYKQKAVSAGDLMAAYIKASYAIMGHLDRQSVETIAGFMFPDGGWNGYKVSGKLDRYVDKEAKLAATVASAMATPAPGNGRARE